MNVKITAPPGFVMESIAAAGKVEPPKPAVTRPKAKAKQQGIDDDNKKPSKEQSKREKESMEDAEQSRKRKKISFKYTPQEASIPPELLPQFDEVMTRDQWCTTKSYTVAVKKFGLTYRISVNWEKQSLWIYGGSVKVRNWAFNAWGGVDKAWEAAVKEIPSAEDLD